MPRAASRDEIAAAYRRLAKAIHPDVATGASPDMRDLNWAWHVLSDPSRRGDWDATHPAGGSHWATSRTSTAGWSPAENEEVAATGWSAGAGWADAPDLPGRRNAFGCIGLLVMAVLLAGLVLIAALYSTVPAPVDDPAEAQATEAAQFKRPQTTSLTRATASSATGSACCALGSPQRPRCSAGNSAAMARMIVSVPARRAARSKPSA
jgi:DnaJ-like protein